MMKIKPEHFKHLKAEIDKVLAKNPDLHDRFKIEGLSYKRLCFDLTYMANLTGFICSNIYPYANDDHLFTALKQIVKKGELK